MSIPAMPPVVPPSKRVPVIKIPSPENQEMYIDLNKIISVNAPTFRYQSQTYFYYAYSIEVGAPQPIEVIYMFGPDDLVQRKIYKPKIRLSKEGDVNPLTFQRTIGYRNMYQQHEDWVDNPEFDEKFAHSLGLYEERSVHPKKDANGEVIKLKEARADYERLISLWSEWTLWRNS